MMSGHSIIIGEVSAGKTAAHAELMNSLRRLPGDPVVAEVVPSTETPRFAVFDLPELRIGQDQKGDA